jgi:photosystem II stability/assembly factor-like uncharacterized protein
MSKWVITAVTIMVAGIAWLNFGSKPTDQSAPSGLTPVASFTHAHGLAVDPIDSSKLYIATHHGLYLLKDDKSLFRIGDKQDDYMGFSLHPTDSSIFFTSGHPMFGGNLGFQKSQDGGKTWQKISDGLNGPVDFHAMSVSPTDPNLIAGWYQGLQISSDGGQNWRMQAGSPDQIISLAFDSKLRERLYAATPHGLMVSDDLGDTWRSLNDDGVAVSVAVSPANNQKNYCRLYSRQA